MRSSLLTVALAATGTLAAQGEPFAGAVRVEGPRIFPAAAAAADFDLDGRRDIVVGNSFSLDARNGVGTVYLLDAAYKLRRAENLPHSGELGLVSHPAVGAGDFDGDLMPDVVALSDKGAFTVYVNQGSTQNPAVLPRFRRKDKHRYLRVMDLFGKEFVQFKSYSLLVGDFSGDGKTDVALCGDLWVFFDVLASSGMTVMLGNGKGGFTSEMMIHSGRFLGMTTCDFNRDGAPDLAGLEDSNHLVIANSRGSGAFRTARYRLSHPSNANRLAVGDVNGDGRADFFASGGATRPEVALYLADSTGAPSKRLDVSLGLSAGTNIESLLLEDMNGDGMTDLTLLVSAEEADAYVLHKRGNGNGTFGPSVIVPLRARIAHNHHPPYPSFLAPADFDGDENSELLVSSTRDSKEDKLVQWVVPNLSARRWGVRHHGAGTAGRGGYTPAISCLGGSPEVGNTRFSVSLANAAGNGAKAALLLSARRERREHAGFVLHMFPFYSFGCSTAGAGAGNGNAIVRLEIPESLDLLGRQFFFQWVVADPAANNPLGLSATNALEVRIGPR